MAALRHIRPTARGPEPPPVIARSFLVLVLLIGAFIGAAITAALQSGR